MIDEIMSRSFSHLVAIMGDEEVRGKNDSHDGEHSKKKQCFIIHTQMGKLNIVEACKYD